MAKDKVKKKANIVSSDPDSFVSSGLADDFDGVVVEARYRPWDYGKGQRWGLFARLVIQPDDGEDVGEDPIEAYYSTGTKSIDHFAPCDADGEAVDLENFDPEEDDIEDVTGVAVVPTGSKVALPKSSNWAFFLEKAKEAGYLKHRTFTGLLDKDLEGLHVHMNRIAQPTRAGLESSGEGNPKDILVITEIHGEASVKAGKKRKTKSEDEPAKSKAGKSDKKKSKPAEDEEEDESGDESDDLESRVVAAVVEILGESKGKTASRTKVTTKAVKMFSGGEKSEALELMGEDEFFDKKGRPWQYDDEEEVLSLDEDDDEEEDEDED